MRMMYFEARFRGINDFIEALMNWVRYSLCSGKYPYLVLTQSTVIVTPTPITIQSKK